VPEVNIAAPARQAGDRLNAQVGSQPGDPGP